MVFGALSDRIGRKWIMLTGMFLVPFIATAIAAATGHQYSGLYYPMGVAAICFIVGAIGLQETHKRSIWDEVGGHSARAAAPGDD